MNHSITNTNIPKKDNLILPNTFSDTLDIYRIIFSNNKPSEVVNSKKRKNITSILECN